MLTKQFKKLASYFERFADGIGYEDLQLEDNGIYYVKIDGKYFTGNCFKNNRFNAGKTLLSFLPL